MKVKTATAFAAAVTYLQIAMKLLATNSWQNQSLATKCQKYLNSIAGRLSDRIRKWGF
jgi:predicted ATPase